MASVNEITIVGNLGADPIIRYLPDGTVTATISVATTDKWKDKTTGETKERTEWHRIVFFKKLAEIVQQYLKKGAQVYVKGSNRTRSWKDEQGIERYITEVRAQSMQMLGSKRDSDGQENNTPPNNNIPQPGDTPHPNDLPPVEDDYIPG